MRHVMLEYDLMLDENIHSPESESGNSWRKKAQAMLDLFKADCGRAAVTLDEVKEWASAQRDDELRLRVERLVSQ